MNISCPKTCRNFSKKWIPLAAFRGIPGRRPFWQPNANLYHYAGNNPVRYVDPDGRTVKSALKLIKKHKEQIIFAAKVFNIEPSGIASVIFQEKYHGIFADLKDLAAYILDMGVSDKTPSTRSYGLAEMQLSLVADIWGLDKGAPGTNKKAYELLKDENICIALIAAYISRNEKEIGQKLEGADAAGAHNMGSAGYKSVLEGTRSKSEVARRSEHYQKAIQDALNGKIDTRKDEER